MDKNQINEKVDTIIQFQKNNRILLLEWKKLINEAKDVIFKTCCKKQDLMECDPWYCSFRMTNNCSYSDELAKLEKLTRIE